MSATTASSTPKLCTPCKPPRPETVLPRTVVLALVTVALAAMVWQPVKRRKEVDLLGEIIGNDGYNSLLS